MQVCVCGVRFSDELTVLREKGDTPSTVFLHAEYQEHPSSAGPPTREWVLTDVAERNQLGKKKRIQKKEEIVASEGNITM